MQDTKETDTAQNIHITTQEKGTKGWKKGFFGSNRSRLCLTLGAISGILLLGYFLVGLYYQKVFFPATTVNDINVSGLTPAQVQEVLNTGASEYILTIIEDEEKTEQISGSEIGLYVNDNGTLQDILSAQNTVTWGLQSFQKKVYSLDIAYNEEKLSSVVNALSCMDKKRWAAPENAYITYEKGTGYKIVPEFAGSEIVADSLLDAVKAAIHQTDNTLSLREAGVYTRPEISADNALLAEQLAVLQPYSDMTVTYQFGDQTEILDADTLSEWLSLDKTGSLVIDEEKAAEFVKGLAKKYNTAYSPKVLETSYGETVTINSGFYGWQISRNAEVESLLEIIRDGKSTAKEPIYLLRAASHDGKDYGDTYVEINLTAQHLFYYKDGELLIESDFVSGNPAKGNATPAGAYAVTYTERNATLRGQNYTTPVSYWMPFNGNIGMHDSSWRSSFGGAIYQTNGSHGCINLPPAVAKTIFENIEKGIPVLCYHLSGTEQDPNDRTEAQIAAETNPAESEEPTVDNVSADIQASEIQPSLQEETPADTQLPDIQTLPYETEPPVDAQILPQE